MTLAGSLNTSIAAAGTSERATLLSRSLPASRYDSFHKHSGGGSGSTSQRGAYETTDSNNSIDESLDTTQDTNATVINAEDRENHPGLSTEITSTPL